MPTKLRGLLDTHRTNFSMTTWPITVLDSLDEYQSFVDRAYREHAAIEADPRLTTKGKREAKDEKAAALLKAVRDLQTKRVPGLEADVAAHRAALLPVTTEKPEARRVDFLLSHLRDKTPQEIATFYDKASDEERSLMEAAAASVGRIPMKTPQGLQWRPLLEPETVNESIIARATAKNPAGAKKLEELSVIRDMHVTVANHAVAEITDVLTR